MKNCLLFLKADEVETKADNMAEAIAQQNKKVEEESKAMEKAIDEKGKQVDTKEQEDKFEKASEKVDAMGNAADKKFEQKGNVLVSKEGYIARYFKFSFKDLFIFIVTVSRFFLILNPFKGEHFLDDKFTIWTASYHKRRS